MPLKDCRFEPMYDSNYNDVVSEFYTPALSNSNSYKRESGFFTSSSFAIAAEGLVEFIANNGKMQILTSPKFSPEDLAEINKLDSDSEKTEYLSRKLSSEITPEWIQNEHVEALGWMLKKGLLEIRIVLVIDDTNRISDTSIFHNKIGILSDGENKLAFSGSINETGSGWKSNIENFDVFCDWEEESQARRVSIKEENFDRYWNLGQTHHSLTVALPEAVKNNWISNVPDNKNELKIFKSRKPRLRPYQKSAIEKWAENGYRGIFNMATGTGKTVTAVSGMKKVMKECKPLTVVIAVPFQHLMEDPWKKTIEKLIPEDEFKYTVIEAASFSNKWPDEATKARTNLRFGVKNCVVLITTYDTFSSQKFIEIVKGMRGKKLVIADEVHNAGADVYSGGLLDEYTFRLGLSATPARYLDIEGTKTLQEYFEKEVFTFDLARAINEINPDTGESYLTPYRYVPVFVSLNEDEIAKYKEINRSLAIYFDKNSKGVELTPNEIRIKDNLLIKRARIIKNTANKLEKLREIIPELKRESMLKHCLIYCAEGRNPNEPEMKTLNSVIEILNENDVKCRRFTSEEKAEERKEILDEFDSGELDTLVAIKCLDEGVDVPSTRNAIIMASTGNPREYIQRRGRVLRRYKGKDFATIYDFVVVPNENPIDLEVEKQIFENESQRVEEFSKFSMNNEETMQKMSKIKI